MSRLNRRRDCLRGNNGCIDLRGDAVAIRAQHELRKAVVASTIGTTIEWYDFFIYGTAAGLIIGELFFPKENALTATLAAFATYFVGFLGRPIGAAIFGHYGDRIGRKATLIATLLCMGIATFLMAFVPTYKSIGIWGAVILTVLRMIQGIGVGGEWGGSVAGDGMVSSPRPSRAGGVLAAVRRTVRSVPGEPGDIGGQLLVGRSVCDLGLAHTVCAVKSSSSASGYGSASAWWRRRCFGNSRQRTGSSGLPSLKSSGSSQREIVLSALIRMSEQAPFYIFTAFIFAYAVGTLHMSRDLILTAVLVASCVSFITIPLSGHLSDRIGRRKMYMIGAAAIGVIGFPYFAIVDSAIPWAVFVAIVVSLIPHDMQYGPQAALIAEAFTPRLRYSGSSLGYQLASIIAGGPAPIIATALFAQFHQATRLRSSLPLALS